MKHLHIDEFHHLADSIERMFDRIEHTRPFLRSVISGAIAGLAVGVVAWLFAGGEILLFACLGSSTAAAVFAPLSRNNSLRTQILAYLSAVAASLLLYPLTELGEMSVAVQCGLAVGASVFFMRWFGAMHPAAVGSALAFVLYDRSPLSLGFLMLAILTVLVLVKVFLYAYLEPLTFNNFHREFRRDYYGPEMRVTVIASEDEQEQEQEEETDA